MTDRREPWRPKSLRDGDEPDPRFTLANERTYLAWIRTSMGLVAGAVALEAFVGENIPSTIRTPVACVLLVLSAVLALMAYRRWLTLESAMRHRRPLPVPAAAPLLAVGVAIGAALLVWAVVSGHGR